MKPQTGAKDFFLYLGATIALYVSVTSFLTLIFAVLDKTLPMAGEYAGGSDGAIRTSIAALVIFLPALFLVSRVIARDLAVHPEKKDLWVRRTMIYLTLFLACLVIAIDLAVLVYRFLGAEDLSARFFLKVLFVMGAALETGRLYGYELSREPSVYRADMRARIWIVSVFAIGAVAAGVGFVGTPAENRAKNLDMTRVNDLSSIQGQLVYQQWENKGSLPVNLAALNDPISGFAVPTDPETATAYGYKKLSATSFELCAVFDAASDDIANPAAVPAYPVSAMSQNWSHAKGPVCFLRTIDPKLYKAAPVK
ncbi:MAG: hypothetical protein KGH93_01230 [Patescibacteria group bacterium]|nr:hypothetical protein [Patescibacteria group bacterium]MDE1945804.1 hypothetical protein [Patescibacteria group bacterium]